MEEEMREKFNIMLLRLVGSKKPNNGFMTKQKYDELLRKVVDSKEKKTGKKPEDYQRLRRYDVVKLDGVEKLVVPVKDRSLGLRLYVYYEELFDIIHKTHLGVAHGGRNRMLKELQGKYKNVTAEAIMLYLSLCEHCVKKTRIGRKLNTKPMLFEEIESRCELDLIDMRGQPDDGFQFILVYQDDLTKFVQLRALKDDSPEMIAFHLIDIFTIFGAPSVVQSNQGREFCDKIVRELYTMWPDLKIVHGDVRESQSSEGAVENMSQQVELMVNAWLESNNTTKWTEGLRFMQLMKNKAFHDSIKCTPYEAMFGLPYKLGLKTTFPLNSINDIWTEEELRTWLERYNSTDNDDSKPEMKEAKKIRPGKSCESGMSPSVTGNQPAADCSLPIVIKEEKQSDESGGETDYDYSQIDKSLRRKLLRKHADEPSSSSPQPNKVSKISAGEVGDTVTLRVPHVEKVLGRVQDLLAVILEIQHGEMYRLGTIHGRLTEWFTRDQFMICEEKFILMEDVPDIEISLEECVRKTSLIILPVSRCICKGGCNTIKCTCKKSGKHCTYKCHYGLMCLNEVV